MQKLSKDEMKKIRGGNYTPPVGSPGECSTSITCSDGSKLSCSSKGADGNLQGGDSCQKVDGLFVDCYDTGAPNNWNYKSCN